VNTTYCRQNKDSLASVDFSDAQIVHKFAAQDTAIIIMADQ